MSVKYVYYNKQIRINKISLDRAGIMYIMNLKVILCTLI